MSMHAFAAPVNS